MPTHASLSGADLHNPKGVYPTPCEIPDNCSTAYLIEDENGDNYFLIDTTNSSEKIEFGNTTTNPDYYFLGSGNVYLGSGFLSLDEIKVADNSATAFSIKDTGDADTWFLLDTTTGSEAMSFGNTNDTPDYNFLGDGTATFGGNVVVTDGNLQSKLLTLPERASNPGATADQGKLYTKDVGSTTELFYQDSAGSVLQLTSAGYLKIPVMKQEVVTTEAITGTDTALADTLDSTPVSSACVALFLNGVLCKQGATFDYTISGSTITWLASSGTAPDMTTGDSLTALYWRY